MNNSQLTLIRAVATAAISALAVLTTYYPHDIWFTAAIAAASAIGIHAIPSISQNGVTTMSTGPELMGIVPVAPTPVEVSETAPEPAESETPPEATPEAETPEGTRAAPVDPKNRVLVALDELIAAVKNL